MSKAAKVKRALLVARKKAQAVLRKAVAPPELRLMQEKPWEMFVPKYREGEPVPGSLHSVIEAQRQQTESWIARSAAYQRYTGRATYGW
jgi:hypothetical protein